MKAINVNDVLKILHKYGKYIFVTDEKKYSSMVDEIANLKALEQESCDDTVSREVFKQVVWERDTAIEQLRKLGYELGQKIEPCDDCVSRSAVLAIAGDSCLDLDSYEDTKEFCDAIKELPPVTPKREQGEWIGDKAYPICPKCNCNIIEEYISCSDYAEMYKPMRYCPNCGAEMR